MIITLTAPQAAELRNPFWHIDLGDGSHFDDDLITELPPDVLIGELAEQDDGSFACAHPTLTIEDADLIRYALNWRATQTAAITALPQGERAAARTTLRTTIRQDARRDARREERVAARILDRREARRLYRRDLRAQAAADGALTEVDNGEGV